MLQVTIWVTWSNEPSGTAWWLAGNSSTTISEGTLVAVPSSVVDSTKGSILVSIENAAGDGVAHLSVTATASTGTVETAVTTAGGCALFPNITATSSGSPTWTVSFGTISGYMTEQELTSIPTQSALSVVADATTSLIFTPASTSLAAYDQAATVTPSYSVPQVNGGLHPALPSNINSWPLSFYSPNLTVSPYLAASPASVVPMSATPSYTVVAGSCGSDSAPDGSATDGQSVTVSPGGTSSPSFSLVPVQIYVVNQSQSNAIVSPATLTAATSNAAGTGSDTNCPTTGSGIMPTLQLGTTRATWTAFHRAHVHHGPSTHGGRKHKGRVAHSLPHDGVLVSHDSFSTQLGSELRGTPAHDTPKPAPTTHEDQGHRPRLRLSSSALVARDSLATERDHSYYSQGQEQASSVHAAVLLATCSSSCATTTTTVTSNLNPSTAGATVTLSTTVTCTTACAASPGIPQGTVTFKDNGTSIGTATLTGASTTASLAISSLAVGTHPISASFATQSASKWSNSSTSTNLSQVVNAAPTTTTLTSNSNPAGYGASPVLTATVTCAASGCGTPTGTVTFKTGGTAISTCTSVALSSGSATCTVSGLAVGTYSMTAAYTPTTNYGSSTSSTLSQVVNTSGTTTTVLASSNPATYGTSPVLTATVTCAGSGCGTPTGTVTFKSGGTTISTCMNVTLSSGSATCTLTTPSVGSYSLTAAYTATSNYASSTSGTYTETVTAASTTTTLTATPNPNAYMDLGTAHRHGVVLGVGLRISHGYGHLQEQRHQHHRVRERHGDSGERRLHPERAQRRNLQRLVCLHGDNQLRLVYVEHDHAERDGGEHYHRAHLERQPQHIQQLGDVDRHRDPGFGCARGRHGHLLRHHDVARDGHGQQLGCGHPGDFGLDDRTALVDGGIQPHQCQQLRYVHHGDPLRRGEPRSGLGIHARRPALRRVALEGHLQHLQLDQCHHPGRHHRHACGDHRHDRCGPTPRCTRLEAATGAHRHGVREMTRHRFRRVLHRGESGMTLIEVTLATLLLALVVTPVDIAITVLQRHQVQVNNRTQALDNLQIAQEAITRDIHAANNTWTSPALPTSMPSTAVTATSLAFTASLGGGNPTISIALNTSTLALTVTCTGVGCRPGSSSATAITQAQVQNIDSSSLFTLTTKEVSNGRGNTFYFTAVSSSLVLDTPKVGKRARSSRRRAG